HDSSSAAWRARRRRLRIRRRSFSAVPPQIPNLSEFSRAYSRHSTLTGQVAQTALAAATESLSPLRGNNRSGSTHTHAPPSIQPVSATTSTLITPPPSWRRAGGSRCRLEPLPEGVVDDAEPGGEAGDHGGLHTGGVEVGEPGAEQHGEHRLDGRHDGAHEDRLHVHEGSLLAWDLGSGTEGVGDNAGDTTSHAAHGESDTDQPVPDGLELVDPACQVGDLGVEPGLELENVGAGR